MAKSPKIFGIMLALLLGFASLHLIKLSQELEMETDKVQQEEETMETAQKDCEEQGGKWGVHGLLPEPSCILPALDAGKACTDGADCEGLCVAKEITDTTGVCSDYKTMFGCHNILQDGEVLGLCID